MPCESLEFVFFSLFTVSAEARRKANEIRLRWDPTRWTSQPDVAEDRKWASALGVATQSSSEETVFRLAPRKEIVDVEDIPPFEFREPTNCQPRGQGKVTFD